MPDTLTSERGENAYQIARSLACNPQTVRNAVHEFNEGGLEVALRQKSRRPHTVHRAFDPEQAETLRQMLHQEPRNFGQDTSLWTLDLAAEVSFEEGITESRISGETVRATLKRLGVRWRRAERWISSPDPEYRRKWRRERLIRLADGRPDWVVGFLDETWFSRLARPSLHS